MVPHLKSYLALRQDCRAVTAAEYGLIVALVGVVISGAVLSFGHDAVSILTKLATTIGST